MVIRSASDVDPFGVVFSFIEVPFADEFQFSVAAKNTVA
jgi:hypothetical protein